ncbi:hypothetical protein B0H34DRAFT_710161 [Crassisporium funariophilum]|nr:hypothetical protein B0H34DRAFT_710161 [Crassisporium funariophilum]
MERVPERLKKWWIEYFVPTVTRLSADTLGPEYSRNAWHLHLFGVMKAHQRKGYGKALFQYAEKLARGDGRPMMLETITDLDVKIYQTFGFRVCGETEVTNWVGQGNMRLMTREASRIWVEYLKNIWHLAVIPLNFVLTNCV